MQTSSSNRIRYGNALKLGLALLTAGLVALPLTGAAQNAPKIGVACTTAAGSNPTFTLDATDGYIQLPDGNTMYMWGYTIGGGAFQHPGPVLCVTEGDTVTVILRNNGDRNSGQYKLGEPISIMFPGQENVLANGVPAQPVFDTSGNLISLTSVAKSTESVAYSFVASKAGSYIYESGTMPQKQVRMGLFGSLIVRPATVPSGGSGTPSEYAYNRVDSRFTPTEEFMVMLSEIDPYQHQAVESGSGYSFNSYQPRYWLINGRGFPDSIVDNYSPALPDQPYGALARIHPFDATAHPYPGRIHYLNVGSENFPFHPHGNNGLVIGRDGQPLASAAGDDLSMEKFAVNIGPGQTWDVIFKWYDAEGYSTTTDPFPVTIPQVNNQEFGMFYSGSPFLGQTGPLPPGASTLNTCGEFYIISHNHALFQITSWGVNMSGPITYVRVDPPMPNSCAP
jgi:FtsP/CotA-like multicopper oxidase with cupredoxin domain